VREAGIDPHDPCREAPAATAPLSAPRGAARNVPSPPSRIEHSGALQNRTFWSAPEKSTICPRLSASSAAPPRATPRAWRVSDTGVECVGHGERRGGSAEIIMITKGGRGRAGLSNLQG